MGFLSRRKGGAGSVIIGHTPRNSGSAAAIDAHTDPDAATSDMASEVVERRVPAQHAQQPKAAPAGPLTKGREPGVKAGENGEVKLADWLFQQLRQASADREAANERRAKLGFRVGFAGVGFALVVFVGACFVVVLNRPNPPAVLRVDNATGEVTVLPTTASGKMTWDQKSDRADLKKYVESRESYDFETVQSMLDRIKLMSSQDEGSLYDSWLRKSPRSPLITFKDSYRVIATYSAITFVGDTAQVYFSKRAVAAKDSLPPNTPVYYGIATIAFEVPEIKQLLKQSDDNPRGFRVLSYTRTPDRSRMTPEALAFWGTD